MRRPGAKQVIDPRKRLEIKAQRRAGEDLPVTQEIAGSNPVAPANPQQDTDFRATAPYPGTKPRPSTKTVKPSSHGVPSGAAAQERSGDMYKWRERVHTGPLILGRALNDTLDA